MKKMMLILSVFVIICAQNSFASGKTKLREAVAEFENCGALLDHPKAFTTSEKRSATGTRSTTKTDIVKIRKGRDEPYRRWYVVGDSYDRWLRLETDSPRASRTSSSAGLRAPAPAPASISDAAPKFPWERQISLRRYSWHVPWFGGKRKAMYKHDFTVEKTEHMPLLSICNDSHAHGGPTITQGKVDVISQTPLSTSLTKFGQRVIIASATTAATLAAVVVGLYKWRRAAHS